MTERDDSVDLQIMEACYDSYKNGRNFPGTIRDPGVEGITVEEFIASERRLMQKGLLSGTVTHTRAGPIYFPISITKEGIKFVNSMQQSIIQKETQSNMIESFKLPALERISKIVSEYFTGFEITGLFKKSGFPEIIHDGSTKWRFLSSTFEEIQKRKHGTFIILKFLETTCDPQEYFKKPESHMEILHKINEVLSFYGMKINEKGKTIKIEQKRDTVSTNTKDDSELASLANNKQWDIFISHASENKETVAKPLVEKLRNMNLSVWYDESNLTWGKSIRKSIDEGLSNSLFGIVILSREFFKKTWTQIELDGLISIMTSTGQDNILPLRYEISNEEVAKVSPTLAGIFSRSWEEGIENLATEVASLVKSKKNHIG